MGSELGLNADHAVFSPTCWGLDARGQPILNPDEPQTVITAAAACDRGWRRGCDVPDDDV